MAYICKPMLVVAAIENHKNKEIDLLCNEYLKRLQGMLPCKIELLPAAREKDAAKQQIKESETILKICRPGDLLILCDEHGKTFKSLEFADYISKQLANSRGKIIFAIGGAYGFTKEMTKKNPCIRLSDLTFPHHLARLVLIEQLYRAANIIKGTGYHHE